MKSLTKLQITTIVFSVLVFVLLYFANKTPEMRAEEASMKGKPSNTASIKVFVDTKITALPDSLKKVYTNLENSLKKKPASFSTLDSLIAFWDKIMQPDVASFYTEKKAQVLKTADAWIKAGERYYYAVRFVKQAEEIGALYQQAMLCFERGLEKDTTNTTAKIKLASCYVEGTNDPMKGIGLLRDIEKTDSNNVELQLAFAAFSSKSGQIDKAIKRFEKVIALKPDYLEAYLYLADAYEQMGNKQKTIETLQKYADLVPDKDAKQEIKKYIDKLKSN